MIAALLLACAPPAIEIGEAPAGDSAAELADDCGDIGTTPTEIVWPWPADSADVRELTLSGCADPLAVSCPTWVLATTPESVSGAALAYLAPDPAAYPSEGACYIGGALVAVALRE